MTLCKTGVMNYFIPVEVFTLMLENLVFSITIYYFPDWVTCSECFMLHVGLFYSEESFIFCPCFCSTVSVKYVLRRQRSSLVVWHRWTEICSAQKLFSGRKNKCGCSASIFTVLLFLCIYFSKQNWAHYFHFMLISVVRKSCIHHRLWCSWFNTVGC